ncbi:D-sedoheptulose-7-phosphate isomerase [Plantactinospora endophytica]|uniref:Phosphoheptose isomerase n=1 Tax=Plantactinospora endophytica TaxID=673535 RepID=A0ABQ4E7P2_9ACTN|nr:SIS domain-containing protein [Plantactinospora endophytica]GIG90718.1 phosphoheptose isomerase [Plantactinospora endophytica]
MSSNGQYPLVRDLDDHLAVVESVRALVADVESLAAEVCARLGDGGILYSFGNGGSAADAQHLVGELVGRYRRERNPLPAVALSTDPTVTTCIGNDYSFDDVFARQLAALARPRDVVVGFTTSGRSPNVVAGLRIAQAAGALTVLFTGRPDLDEKADGTGRPAPDPLPAAWYADRVIAVGSARTDRVQEAHVLLLHLLSEHIDRWAATRHEPLDAAPRKG